MRHSLRKKIISGIAAFAIVLSASLTHQGVFGEGMTDGNDSSNVNSASSTDAQSESSLHALMTEKTEEAELLVYSDSVLSDIEVTEKAVEEPEEGLEVIKSYEFTDREESSDESLWVEVNQSEEIELAPCESLSLYSVEDGKVEDTIIEDISEDTGALELKSDISGIALVKDTGFRHLNFSLGESSDVTLDGMMPKDAAAEAIDVSEYIEDENVIAAYDITIKTGEDEYQPGEERPVDVQICDQDIKEGSELQLWHIKDDGTKEQINDFGVEDGKVSFSATGFSVYEIVSGPDVYVADERLANSADEMVASVGGVYLRLSSSGMYISNSLNSNDAFAEKSSWSTANTWFVEKKSETEELYYLYTMVSGAKKYVSHTDKNTNNSAALVDDKETADTYNIIKNADGVFYFQATTNSNKFLQHSGKGNGLRYHENQNENGLLEAILAASVSMPDDPYGLNGKTYGLACFMNGANAYTLTPEKVKNANKLKSLDVRVKVNPLTHNNINFIAEDNNVYLWTFHSAGKDKYKISTVLNGEEKYLKLTSSGLTMVDEAEASEIQVIPGTGEKEGKFRLAAGTTAIVANANSSIFEYAADKTGEDKYWFDFINPSDLLDDDFVVYSAAKVSISDKVNVSNGAKVVVYTRIWDDDDKCYKFYAIDHDGTLVPCYERGDNIMWIGTQVNTMLWDFTEYYYEGTTDPNYYYELQNEYSKKYIAPQLTGNQALSDSKIGINIPGRRTGDFYSDILAWDNTYYAYAAFRTDIVNDMVTSGSKSKADSFYFAIMNPDEEELEEVETIDNNQFGITMKLIDFPDKTGNGHNIQDDVLNDYTIWENHKEVPLQGILSTNIIGDPKTGYPTNAGGTRSLSELFGDAKTVNHLFLSSTYNASGYFEFDSCQNYATLQHRDSGDFVVYKELATADTTSKPSLQHGQFLPFDDIDNYSYAKVNAYNLYDATQKLLPNDDPRKYERLYLIDDPEYYIGMELGASFEQTQSGCDAWGHDMIFEFTGDDDFWLYTDGELVIDLGGIHSALGGRVDFKTGEVVVNGKKSTLRDIYRDNYKKRNPNPSDAALETFMKQYFTYDSKLGDYEPMFKDYSSHSMRIFYMERGAGASNLHMRFNLSYVTPGSVTLKKDVSNRDGTLNEDLDFDIVQYPFQIYFKREGSTVEELLNPNAPDVDVSYVGSVQKVDFADHYTPPGCSKVYDNVFFLNQEKTIEINFPSDAFAYKLVECGVNSQVYEGVTVNGKTLQGDPVPGCSYRFDYTFKDETVESGWIKVGDTPKVTFDNCINPDGLRSLYIQKHLYDENGQEIDASADPTDFSFRLYLANGEKNEPLAAANMVKYRVLSPQGEYCRWDPGEACFVSLGKSIFSNLNADEKESATFETSMNGSISRIRAGYTVEVPNLPIGTKFKVEERASEVPMGYHLKEYRREEGTYKAEEGDTLNSGTVRENESPVMHIDNKRGWELKAEKVWSDKDFTDSHDPVYFAVFVNGSILPDTIKEIKGSNTSVRYFFSSLETGSTFDDYEVREIKVTNPSVDASGNVTSYTSWEQITDFISVGAKAKGSSETKDYQYEPSVEVGTATYTYAKSGTVHSTGQVRTDTVTNTRKGGIVIDLYKMGTTTPLAGGKFTLTNDDGDVLGEYESDARGRVTIIYDIVRGANYHLTETESPSSYIGLPNTVDFSVSSSDVVSLSGNDNHWQNCTKTSQGDNFVAYIKLYNKQFVIKVKKFDSTTDSPVEGVHFALYKGVTTSSGTIRKDYYPIIGYEDLLTDADGIISGIDSTVTPGKYYLVETQAKEGFVGITGDIEFTFNSNGVLTLDKYPPGSNVSLDKTEGSVDDIYEYTIKVPNSSVTGTVDLSISKVVTGNLGDTDKEFTFTFEVKGDNGTTPYEWKKNDVQQATPLKSGNTFKMKHGDNVVITLPAGSIVTISEDTEGYKSQFKFNSEDAETVETLTFPVLADTTLEVTNNLSSIIPTGVGSFALALIALAGGLAVLIVLKIRRMRKLRANC